MKFVFRFESELAMRQLEEADISGIRKVLDQEPQRRTQLELQLECLKEELMQLKHNHKEVRSRTRQNQNQEVTEAAV